MSSSNLQANSSSSDPGEQDRNNDDTEYFFDARQQDGIEISTDRTLATRAEGTPTRMVFINRTSTAREGRIVPRDRMYFRVQKVGKGHTSTFLRVGLTRLALTSPKFYQSTINLHWDELFGMVEVPEFLTAANNVFCVHLTEEGVLYCEQNGIVKVYLAGINTQFDWYFVIEFGGDVLAVELTSQNSYTSLRDSVVTALSDPILKACSNPDEPDPSYQPMRFHSNKSANILVNHHRSALSRSNTGWEDGYFFSDRAIDYGEHVHVNMKLNALFEDNQQFATISVCAFSIDPARVGVPTNLFLDYFNYNMNNNTILSVVQEQNGDLKLYVNSTSQVIGNRQLRPFFLYFRIYQKDVEVKIWSSKYKTGHFLTPGERQIIVQGDEEKIADTYDKMLQGQLTCPKINGVNLNAYEIGQLKDKELLSAPVVDFYLQLICARNASMPNYPKIGAFDPAVMKFWATQKFRNLERMSAHVDIHQCDLILVPYHVDGNHWIIMVMDMLAKCLDVFDSFSKLKTKARSHEAEISPLKKFLEWHSEKFSKKPIDWSGWNFNEIRHNPQQKNNVKDCGIFICQVAESLSRRVFPRFTLEDMPTFRRTMLHEMATGRLHDIKPIMFHPNVEPNTFRTPNGDFARRHKGDSHAYVFTEKPVRPMQKVTVQVVEVNYAFHGGLAFGVTTRDPANYSAVDLSDDPVYMESFPHIQVGIRETEYRPKVGTNLSFWITERGEVKVQIDSMAPFTCLHINYSKDVWFFFNLFGSTIAITALGKENMLNAEEESGNQPESSFQQHGSSEDQTTENDQNWDGTQPGPSSQFEQFKKPSNDSNTAY